MIMKKYVQNFWVRFLACVLCSVTVVTGIAAGILVAGVSTIGSKEEVYKDVQEVIAENYAAYIYDKWLDTDDLEQQELQEKLEVFLSNKNFNVSVTELLHGDEDGNVSINEPMELYNSLVDDSDWDYVVEIPDESYVHYNIESVLDAIRISPVIEDEHYTLDTAITGYLFDPEAGLFYYDTVEFRFLAEDILVSQDGVYYDYKIKNGEDGKLVYYNGYYDLTLDTSEYREWDWVKLNDNRCLINETEYSLANGIEVMREDLNYSRIYTGIYYNSTDYNSITYYPERLEDTYTIKFKMHSPVVEMDDDMFYEWKLVCDAFFDNKGSYQVVLGFSIFFFILTFALLIYSANNDKEKIGLMQKIPVGIFTACVILVEIPLAVLLNDIVIGMFREYVVLPFDLWLTIAALNVFVMVFFVVIWLQNIISRFKTKTFIRYSEIYYGYGIIKWCWGKFTIPFKAVWKLATEYTTLFVRGLVVMLVISFVQFIVIVACRWDWDIYLFLFFVVKVVEIPLVIFTLLQMQKLQDGSKRIAAGDLSEPIDTSKMIWEFKKHGENINKVSDGIALAVEDRMKSERFKTELITNVSHDIKTPLTSIINYVDLIKKEEIQDETLQEYVDVLDRQSTRLKKLIEDLMEASKASTGNLAVNLEDCDVDVLLTQLIGEFEEKLSANQLEVVVQKPEHPVMVSADGRHMWRVLDNLLNNACKYSLPGTRVYVSLVQEGNDAIITFKNISKTALNIPSDELMERFVRGDSSRNTEGSGLGLSIAQSLTELMNGSMKLEIDGDLFKVILKFQGIDPK